MEVINTRPLLEDQDSSSENDEFEGTNSLIDDIGTDDTKPIFKVSEPGDYYHMAYYIFYLLGFTSLLPWNFFITADDYWMYKFRDPNSTVLLYASETTKRTSLQASFISYVTIASNIPSIIVLTFNVVLIHKVSLRIRVVGSLLTMLCLFILTTVCVKINTDSWQRGFFYMTIATIVILNMASSVFLGSLTAVMGKFPPSYITAVISGQALGGVLAAVAQVISLSIGASSEHSALFYFTIGIVVILISTFGYLLLSKTAFFKFHLSERMGILNKMESPVRPHIINYKIIYKKILVYGISAFIIFLITLSVFPGVTVLVESEGKGNGSKWNDIYFVPVATYLLFNVGDYFGRVLAGFLHWPHNPWTILGLCLLRIALIPLLIMCNAQPRTHLPVIFDKDYYYFIVMILFSLSSGYLINIVMQLAPRVVEFHEKETASSIMAVFIGGGLVSGSFISVLLVKCL